MSGILNNLRAAQANAPFNDGMGLVAATLAGGDTLPPLNQCLNTPFQCIPERVGIAATAWAIFAEQGYNPLAPSPLLAAVLPASRSVQINGTATAFATIINNGPATATSCSISPTIGLPVTFHHQSTDPRTNALTGTVDTPVDIPAGGSQSFVIALTPTSAVNPTNVPFTFTCVNTSPAPINIGLNSLLFSASTTPVPDVVALAATLKNDGILHVTAVQSPFAVATLNVGAGGAITVATNTASVTLPLTVTMCQTDPKSGQCITPISSTVATTINANTTPTFGFFATASASIPLDPANSRIFVTFSDSGGAVRGETSVAVDAP